MRTADWLLATAVVALILTARSSGASIAPATEARTFKGHTGPVTAVAFSPDGSIVASASADTTVKLWDVKTGEIHMTLSGHAGAATCVAFSPDGRILASGGADSEVNIWDLATGKIGKILSAHTSKVKCLAFSSDGARLASGGEDATIHLWNVSTGRLGATLKGHSRAVLSVAFTPDGAILASGSADQSVKLWSAMNGHDETPDPLLHRGKHGAIDSVAFSPDGLELAMATKNFVAIWEFSHVERRFALKGRRNGTIFCARYAPQGRLLATACGANDSATGRGDAKRGSAGHSTQLKENEIRLWNPATGRDRGSLNGHAGPVRAIDFSPDGRLIASGSADQTVMVWDVARYQEWEVGPSEKGLSVSAEGDPSPVTNDDVASEIRAMRCDDDEAQVVLEIEGSIAGNPPRRKGKEVRPIRGRPTAAAPPQHESHSKGTVFQFQGGGGGGGGGWPGKGGGGGNTDHGRK